MILDPSGVYGEVLHYSMIIAFVGSALLIFLHLWKKGKLDMDEEPKLQMLLDEETTQRENKHVRRK